MRGIKLDPADIVYSQYIRKRDGKCLRCSSQVQYNAKGLPITHQASHFQGRGKEATRFDDENVCCLCAGCHQYFTANPAEHYLWQVKRLGQARVNHIIVKSNTYHKKDRKWELLKAKELLKRVK